MIDPLRSGVAQNPKHTLRVLDVNTFNDNSGEDVIQVGEVILWGDHAHYVFALAKKVISQVRTSKARGPGYQALHGTVSPTEVFTSGFCSRAMSASTIILISSSKLTVGL